MPVVPHDYMERCPYCKEYLLAKQVSSHKCNTSLNDVKEIPVVFFYEAESGKGASLIVAMGFDGVLYRLVKCKNPLSDDWKHSDESNGEVTEPVEEVSKFKKLL